jgi:hypothetical protein
VISAAGPACATFTVATSATINLRLFGSTFRSASENASAQTAKAATGGALVIAAEAGQPIAALYAIESAVHGKFQDVRRAVRQARSKPLVE